MDVGLRRFSVEEYHRLSEAGILGEDDRVELLEGLVVRKLVRNPRHDLALSLSEEALTKVLPGEWFCRIQSAITTADSEPEPDLAVVRGPRRRHADAHPTPADVALVVEVADASLARDRGEKARLCARAGIARYWIINVADAVLEAHAQPDPATASHRCRTTLGAERLASIRTPGAQEFTVRVADLLPWARRRPDPRPCRPRGAPPKPKCVRSWTRRGRHETLRACIGACSGRSRGVYSSSRAGARTPPCRKRCCTTRTHP